MDLTKIKSTVLNQLTNRNGLYSLKLQNHIYGCFIIMEDLAQGGVNLSGTILSTPKYSFDLDKQFSTIGVRYGFAMDTHLVLETFSPEYHNTWIQYFKDIYSAKDIKDVDNIEDCLIEVVQSCVKADEAFFVTALETGSLPQEWIEKVLNLLHPPITTAVTTGDVITEEKKVLEKDEEVLETALTKATAEKPLITRRYLATTRRSHPKTDIAPLKKKALAKTRRQTTKPTAT
jgi:hypothetical protein